MKKPIHTINEYREVETDVWNFFKKYFNNENLDDLTDDIHRLDTKYKNNLRMYCFMNELLRVHFKELDELKKNKGE